MVRRRRRPDRDPRAQRPGRHDRSRRWPDRCRPQRPALRYAYDGSGLLASITAVAPGVEPRVVRYEHESGLLTAVTSPGGLVTRYSYDAAGRLASQSTGDRPRPEVTTSYDGSGRVVAQTDGNGHTTRWSWEPGDGGPLSGTSTMTDPVGGKWLNEYRRGWLVKQTDPTGRTVRCSRALASAAVTQSPTSGSTVTRLSNSTLTQARSTRPRTIRSGTRPTMSSSERIDSTLATACLPPTVGRSPFATFAQHARTRRGSTASASMAYTPTTSSPDPRRYLCTTAAARPHVCRTRYPEGCRSRSSPRTRRFEPVAGLLRRNRADSRRSSKAEHRTRDSGAERRSIKCPARRMKVPRGSW